jgi:nucleotide-binding universal stress UspA family protein
MLPSREGPVPTEQLSFYLPLVTYPDPSPRAPIARALDLAATLGGKVTAIVHEVDIPPIADPLGGLLIDIGSLIAAAEAQSRAASAALSQDIQREAERLALPLTVMRTSSRPELAADVLSPPARTHDFSLLLPQTSEGWHTGVAEAILFGSGGPAFLFPAHDVPVHLNCVAIAWDGSRAAARALRDALPMLKRAGRTVVVTAGIDKPAGLTSAGAAQNFLDDHGIASTRLDLPDSGESVGTALQRAAIEQDAGLLVMGAYGHSRFREFVLGGATRGVLRDQRLPILMSH